MLAQIVQNTVWEVVKRKIEAHHNINAVVFPRRADDFL